MKVSSRLGRRSRAFFVFCACVYPFVLAFVALGFYVVGEHWWVTGAGLYAPRFFFALPLPFTVAALWLAGRRGLLWTQLVAGLLLFFPLFGFVVPHASTVRVNAPKLRVLSFNVNSTFAGVAPIARGVVAEAPDLVLVQEATWGSPLVEALRASFPFVQTSTQFIIASRYPISSATDPDRLSFSGRLRSPCFMRYTIDTPLGSLAVYNVHPRSPRGVLHLRQFRATLHELRTGEMFAGDPETDVTSNAALRTLQLATAADRAARETLPVIIAGDTNLPGLSAIAREHLSGFADGFHAASWGFGYTFPERHPFLRLDRILTNEKLRVVGFHVDCRGLSDHRCVVADIQASE